MQTPSSYVLDYESKLDPQLQQRLEQIDASLRARLGITTNDAAAGILNLRSGRLAMLYPDRMEYAASVPKVGILLAWFQLHPDAATHLDPATRHELGLMIKQSSNEIAAKYSTALGLKQIQAVLNQYGLYDAQHGGGMWVGKHYGKDTERYPDPVGGFSHGVTVRQLLRFYVLMEQGKFVSPGASATMREIFASPDIPHLDDRFVKALHGRDVTILRKSGWWEDWFLDSAIVEGPHRKYIVVGITHHARGDEYLEELARQVDAIF